MVWFRLLARNGDAFLVCRRAVAGGAAIRVWDGAVPAAALVGFTRRLRLVRRRGTAERGFTEVVRALRAYGDQLVRLGEVRSHDPPYHFQIFLNGAATDLVACLGVELRAGG